MPKNTRSVQARIRKFREKAARIEKTLDREYPAYTVTADDYAIDDGGGYGEIADKRPDFVQADDAAWRRRKFEV